MRKAQAEILPLEGPAPFLQDVGRQELWLAREGGSQSMQTLPVGRGCCGQWKGGHRDNLMRKGMPSPQSALVTWNILFPLPVILQPLGLLPHVCWGRGRMVVAGEQPV